MKKKCFVTLICLTTVLNLCIAQEKPNILVISGDNFGQINISAYASGVVGYKTPNHDKPAKEGMIFTDYYAETFNLKIQKVK